MTEIRKVQVFIHRYYDAIKIVMLLIIMSLVGLFFLYQIQSNAEASARRGEAVLALTKTIEDKTDNQTRLQTRQMQALCYIIIQIAGQEALSTLDPPLEEQCRDLAIELKQGEGEAIESANLQQTQQRQDRTSTVAQSATTQSSTNTKAQSDNQQPQQATIGDAVGDAVGGLVNGVGDLVLGIGRTLGGR